MIRRFFTKLFYPTIDREEVDTVEYWRDPAKYLHDKGIGEEHPLPPITKTHAPGAFKQEIRLKRRRSVAENTLVE